MFPSVEEALTLDLMKFPAHPITLPEAVLGIRVKIKTEEGALVQLRAQSAAERQQLLGIIFFTGKAHPKPALLGGLILFSVNIGLLLCAKTGMKRTKPVG